MNIDKQQMKARNRLRRDTKANADREEYHHNDLRLSAFISVYLW
jgi:hypothetical protein